MAGKIGGAAAPALTKRKRTTAALKSLPPSAPSTKRKSLRKRAGVPSRKTNPAPRKAPVARNSKPRSAAGSIFSAAAIDAAIRELSAREKRLALLLEKFPPEPRERPANLFSNLCRTVCAQMLSFAAANTIFGRIEGLCERTITPASVARISDGELRSAGLSNAKVASFRAIADYYEQDGNIFGRLDGIADEEVEEALLGIRGLGPWSAEMFMLFSLGRMDVYSARDAALATGLIKLKRLPKETPRPRLDSLAERYAPYRSVVSLALWKWRHNDWAAL